MCLRPLRGRVKSLKTDTLQMAPWQEGRRSRSIRSLAISSPLQLKCIEGTLEKLRIAHRGLQILSCRICRAYLNVPVFERGGLHSGYVLITLL